MKKAFFILLIPALVAVSSTAVHATVITFDSLASTSGDLTFLPSYEESGFLFSVKTKSGRTTTFASPGSSATSYYAGSAALTPSAGNAVTTLTKVGGGTFNLTSIDLSEWFSNRAMDKNYHSWHDKIFTGTLADGSIVQSMATLDNVFGFQTFDFGSTFNDIVSVSWSNNPAYYQFDNVTVSESAAPVPEPCTMLLLGVGLSAFAIFRRKITT